MWNHYVVTWFNILDGFEAAAVGEPRRSLPQREGQGQCPAGSRKIMGSRDWAWIPSRPGMKFLGTLDTGGSVSNVLVRGVQMQICSTLSTRYKRRNDETCLAGVHCAVPAHIMSQLHNFPPCVKTETQLSDNPLRVSNIASDLNFFTAQNRQQLLKSHL